MGPNLPVGTEFPNFVLDCHGRLSAMCCSAGVARPGAPGSHLPPGSESQAGNGSNTETERELERQGYQSPVWCCRFKPVLKPGAIVLLVQMGALERVLEVQVL